MMGSNRSPLVCRIPTFTQMMMTVLEYSWALVVVLNGNSVYHANAFKSYHLMELSLGLTILLLAVTAYVYRARPARDQVLMAVGLMLYAVVYMGVKQTQMAVAIFMTLFIAGLPCLFLLFAILHERGQLLRLMRKLFDVVFVLALLSLYYWTFGVMLGLIRPNCVMAINWGYSRQVLGYDGVQFMTQMDTTFFPEAFLYRNSGIFAEAPMFNLWLDLALAGELFLKPRASRLRVVVLVITILTTMSLTGILFIVLCAAIHICKDYHNMDRRQRIAILFAGALLLPLAAGVMIYALVLKSDTESYTMRLYDYVAGVLLWLDYPLFGSGYGDLTPLMQYAYSPNGVMGFSNSLTAVLGTGGLWMALVFYIPHLSMLSPRITGDKKLVCFGACDLFLFCSTLYCSRYIGMVLVAFSMVITYCGRRKNV